MDTTLNNTLGGTLINSKSERITINHIFSRNHKVYTDTRLGDIKHFLAAVSKARDILGYSPKYTTEV